MRHLSLHHAQGPFGGDFGLDTSLTSLAMHQVRLVAGEAGVFFENLRKNTSLRKLDLRQFLQDRLIRIPLAQAIQRLMMENKHIEYLDVAYNDFNSHSFEELKEMLQITRTLREVHFEGNHFGEELATDLVEWAIASDAVEVIHCCVGDVATFAKRIKQKLKQPSLLTRMKLIGIGIDTHKTTWSQTEVDMAGVVNLLIMHAKKAETRKKELISTALSLKKSECFVSLDIQHQFVQFADTMDFRGLDE